MERACLLENGQAEAPEKRHKEAVKAVMTAFPTMATRHSAYYLWTIPTMREEDQVTLYKAPNHASSTL